MANIDTDVCVVGGGPAGLTLALLLARSGVRVAVVERTASLERPYRGEILQPGGQALLAELGVLAGARDRGCHEHSHFRFVDRGRVLLDIDYRSLPAPFNCLLSVPQRHLLAELQAACDRYGVTVLAGHKVSDLVRDDARIAGVLATGPDGVRRIRARYVVGADGRYSKTRRLAGIENDRLDVFDHDVLWFRIPDREGPAVPEVRIHRGGGNPVLVYRSFPDQLQIGWTLPHHGYRALAARGIDHVRAELTRAIPQYGDLIDKHVTALSDLTLLDVFAATARSWTADGLVLIGDAAHTHSPIGAQGINLAVQDAVALHPVLLDALRSGDADAAALDRFAAARRPDIHRVMRTQVIQSRAMLTANRVLDAVRPRVARLLSHTPVYRKVLRHIAYGNPAIQPRTDLFVR
jgi:monooxygenase